MSKRSRILDRLREPLALPPADDPRLPSIMYQAREARKMAIAKHVLPFFKEIRKKAEKYKIQYDRTKLELIVEACRDYLMAEARDDPELDEDQKMAVAEMVTGIAKGWTFARELLDKDALSYVLPLYVVLVEHLEQISEAIGIEVLDRGELDIELLQEIQGGDPSRAPP